jgi:cytochrome c oxidase subunit 4
MTTAAPPRLATYFTVYALLLAGLAATVAVSYVHLGPFNVALMLAIAFFKAALVVLYFMHVRESPRLIWLAAAAGLIWLAIMMGFMLSDYMTRDWLPPRADAPLALPPDGESLGTADDRGAGSLPPMP